MSADNWTDCPECGGEFREDYEIGVYEDEFFVSYRGACRGCKAQVAFEHSQPFSHMIRVGGAS